MVIRRWKRASIGRGVVYSGVRREVRISASDVTLSKLRRHRVAATTFRLRTRTHWHNMATHVDAVALAGREA